MDIINVTSTNICAKNTIQAVSELLVATNKLYECATLQHIT